LELNTISAQKEQWFCFPKTGCKRITWKFDQKLSKSFLEPTLTESVPLGLEARKLYVLKTSSNVSKIQPGLGASDCTNMGGVQTSNGSILHLHYKTI
jgi:hypothetical protein